MEPPRGWPLLGRDDELAALRVARAIGDPGVVISGAPGAGRSSVLGAIVDEWRDRRTDVLVIRATSSARRLRYAALSPLLLASAPGTGTDTTDVSDPSDVNDPTDGPLGFDRVHGALVERAEASLQAGVGGRGLVIAIDDVHLVDEASLRVIADLVGHHGVFVVATVDETFLGLDPLTQHESLRVATLAPLDERSVGDLVAARTGEPRPAVDDARWWLRCGGNPTALLAALGDPGLDQADAIPAGLSTDARSLLGAIAVAEPLAVDHLGHVGGRPIEAALVELAARSLVAVVDEAGRAVLRFRHPGRAALVRQALGAIEARAARRTAIETMRATWATLGPTERLRMAALAVGAGVELAEHELLDVVGLAPGAGDAELALRLARRGVERLGRFDDLRRLADVAHEQGAVDDVVASIEAMSSRASSVPEHLAVAVARSQHELWRRADAAAAVAALDDSPAAELPELRAVRARLLATIGAAAPAIAAGEPLRHHADPRVRTQASLAVAHALRRTGRPARAVEVLDDALGAAGTVDDPVLSVSGQVLSVGRVLAMVEAGRWSDALAAGTRVVAYAERYDERAGRGVALLVHAVALVESGSPALALAPLADAVELFDELHQPAGARWSYAVRALAHGLMADAVAAQADLAALDRIGPHPADLFPAIEPRARAWARVAAADPESARTVLREALDGARVAGDLGPAWAIAHDLLSLDQPTELLDLPALPDEPLTGLRVRHALAVQSRDADALASLADDYERLGSLRWAAECVAAQSRASTRSGSRDAARRATERLGSLRARCVGLDIPALAGGALLSLSAREREVALLAARGLASREIAERLGVSIRTVDNHLSRCYDKLGTRSRTELASLLDG